MTPVHPKHLYKRNGLQLTSCQDPVTGWFIWETNWIWFGMRVLLNFKPLALKNAHYFVWKRLKMIYRGNLLRAPASPSHVNHTNDSHQSRYQARCLIYQRCVSTKKTLNLACGIFPTEVGIYPFWTWRKNERIFLQMSNHACRQLLEGWSTVGLLQANMLIVCLG